MLRPEARFPNREARSSILGTKQDWGYSTLGGVIPKKEEAGNDSPSFFLQRISGL